MVNFFFFFFLQFSEEPLYVDDCFNRTLVQANADNKKVNLSFRPSFKVFSHTVPGKLLTLNIFDRWDRVEVVNIWISVMVSLILNSFDFPETKGKN